MAGKLSPCALTPMGEYEAKDPNAVVPLEYRQVLLTKFIGQLAKLTANGLPL